MKVHELIEKLLKLPQDLPVMCADEDDGRCFFVSSVVAGESYMDNPVVMINIQYPEGL